MTVPALPATPALVPGASAPGAVLSDVATGAPLPASATCANCLAPLASPWCGACGAPRLEDRPLTVRRFVDDAWAELTSVDSATLRTARSFLTRPGELTQAYVEGRTRWFLSPLRVFLACFALFVFSQSVIGDPTEAALRDVEQQMSARLPVSVTTASATARQTVARAATPAATRAERRAALLRDLPRRYTAAARDSARNSWFQLVIVAPWALLLALLYRGRRWNYAQHVVMALHLFAANTLVLIANTGLHAALGWPKTGFDALSVVQWLGIGTYFYLASRRVHGESKPRTAGKTVLFVAGAQVAMIAVPLLAITLMLAQFAVQMALAAH